MNTPRHSHRHRHRHRQWANFNSFAKRCLGKHQSRDISIYHIIIYVDLYKYIDMYLDKVLLTINQLSI